MTTTSEYRLAFTVDATLELSSLESALMEFGDVHVLRGKGSIWIVGDGV